jgi:hypothetical protein
MKFRRQKYNMFVRKLTVSLPLQRPRSRRKDNTEMDLGVTNSEAVN